jgi:dienelactone hydrolase
MLLQSFLSATLAGMLLVAPVVHADTSTAQCVARSTASLDALVRGDYAGARKDFNATVSQAVDAARLEQVWTQIQSQAGAYQKHAEPQRQNMGGHDVVVTPMSFANTPLDFVLACDDDGKISTFRFMPAGAAAAAAHRSAPPPASAHTEADGVRVQPLAVTSPLGPLQGVLTLPAGKGPFSVVLLVAGSGPNDRDETIGPNKPFRDIAQRLAVAGIASLRYDKRTHVYGAQMVGKTITVDEEVTDDALTALQELSEQTQIDPRRMFVLGHSLGALMAPRIGERDPQLAGLILLAAPASFGLDTVVHQMRYIGHLKGMPAAELDKQLAPVIKARDELAHSDPAKPPEGLFFHAPGSYWLSLRDYNAVTVAKTLHMPMLVLQGGGDYQVTPKDDFIQWQDAFAHSARVRLQEYPGLSHLFMPAGQPPSPADYDKPGHVDAQVIRDIAAWVKEQPAHS